MPSASNFTNKTRVAAEARNIKAEYPGGTTVAIQPYISTICSSTVDMYNHINYEELCDCKLRRDDPILVSDPAPAPAPAPTPAPVPVPGRYWRVSTFLSGISRPVFLHVNSVRTYFSELSNRIRIYSTTTKTLLSTISLNINSTSTPICVDSSNTLYYYNNYAIYKRTLGSSSNIKIAGTNIAEYTGPYVDSPASSTSIQKIIGMTVANNGDLYLIGTIDGTSGLTAVLKLTYNPVSPNNYTITSLLYNIEAGDEDEIFQTINSVGAIAVDANNNIYTVSYSEGVYIYKLVKNPTTGVYTRIIIEPGFQFEVRDIRIDLSNVIYATCVTGDVYKVVDTAGTYVITKIAGTGNLGYFGDNGPALNARFDTLNGIHIHSGEIYIADTYNNRIRKLQYIV